MSGKVATEIGDNWSVFFFECPTKILERVLVDLFQYVQKIELKKQILAWLPTIVYCAFLAAWFLFSFSIMSPLVKTLPIDKISDVSRSMIQVSGILIGFTGLSAFFFLGKIVELSERVCSKIIDVTRLWAEYRIEYQGLLREIKRMEAEILSGQKDSKKSVTKKIERLKKEIQKAKTHVDEEYQEISKSETEVNELSKKTTEVMRGATKWSFVTSMLAISFFIGCLVLSFVLELTGQLKFLNVAIDFIVIGVAFLVFDLFNKQSNISHIGEILNDCLFFSSHVVSAHLEMKNTIENVKLWFAIEKTKLD